MNILNNKDKFIVLEGIILGSTLNKDNIQIAEINYPVNCNINNVSVISSMVGAIDLQELSEYEGRASTTLQDKKIIISFENAWGVDMKYRIVLYKYKT